MEAAIQTMNFYEKKLKPLASKTYWELDYKQRHSKEVYLYRLGKIYKFITENFRKSTLKRYPSKVNDGIQK